MCPLNYQACYASDEAGKSTTCIMPDIFGCVTDCVLLHRVKSKEDALYELPEKLKVKSQLKQSEEMLSNQMLSGIPEVNLGIQAKIRNIEATEEAKMKMIEERRSKKNQGPSIMVPTNVAVDFMQHNRCKLCRVY